MKYVAIISLLAADFHGSSFSFGQEVSGWPESNQRDVLCRVAVCFSGNIRPFVNPVVHNSIRRNLIEAIEADGCQVDIFAYATLNDNDAITNQVRINMQKFSTKYPLNRSENRYEYSHRARQYYPNKGLRWTRAATPTELTLKCSWWVLGTYYCRCSSAKCESIGKLLNYCYTAHQMFERSFSSNPSLNNCVGFCTFTLYKNGRLLK